MRNSGDYTKPEHEFSDLLKSIFEHGDQTNVAHAAGFKQQHLWEMLADDRPNPLERTAKLYRALVELKNPKAEMVLIELARACGFVAYRSPLADSQDGKGFAAVMREVSDASGAFSDLIDDNRKVGERRAYAQQLTELADAALRERDRQIQLADEEEERANNVRTIGGSRS